MNYFLKNKSGNIKMLEDALVNQIAELKANLNDGDLQAAAKTGSSLGQLKTEKHYQRDREMALNSLLTVPCPPPQQSQYRTMLEEIELCLQPHFTEQNIPLYLHRFFTERLKDLIQQTHQLRLRWSRLAVGQLKVTELLVSDFQKRIQYLMLEYSDCLNRCKRLAKSCDRVTASYDSQPAQKVWSSNLVMGEDVLIFLRWLVYHQHMTRRSTSFIASLQWFPMLFDSDLRTDVRQPRQPHQQQPSAGREFKQPSNDPVRQWISSRHSLTSTSQHKGVAPSSAPAAASSLKNRSMKGDHPLMGVPLHDIDLVNNSDLLQELMQAYGIMGPSTFPSQVEQLQFYYQVMGKFKCHFQNQEVNSTLYTYDKPLETSKLKKCNLTFKKVSNWRSFVRVHGCPDPVQVKAGMKMTQDSHYIDPLLSLSTNCTHLHSMQRVLYALRQHSVTVRRPSSIKPLSVPSKSTPHNTLLIWKSIYSGLDSRNPLQSDDTTSGEIETEEQDKAEKLDLVGGDSSSVMVDVAGAITLVSSKYGRKLCANADHTPKDVYMGFLLLRHLRIRDLRAKCLSLLNYFRSVERTLTINAQELSLEDSTELRSGKPSAFLNRRHLFNTQADFLVDQSDFLRCMEVENHDDFYSFQSDGSVQVWDQKGVAIVYDSTLQDLHELEQELMGVGCYYMRMAYLKQSERKTGGGAYEKDWADQETLSQHHVDRFAVLLDLWSCEILYLQAKMKVLNCYLEAYHHSMSSAQRSSLHQVMTDLLSARPRYDTDEVYFTSSYRKEVLCLDLLSQLLLSLAHHQMKEERAHNQLMCTQDLSLDLMNPDLDPTSFSFGLPLPLAKRRLVSLTGDRILQIHSYILEFCESLSVLASVPQALRWTLNETCITLGVDAPSLIVSLHCKLLEQALKEWDTSPPVGDSYIMELNRQIFSADVGVADPGIMTKVFHAHCANIMGKFNSKTEVEGQEFNYEEKEKKMVCAWTDLLQLVHLHHHLNVTCSETEILTRIYKQQLHILQMDECHAQLCCISFDTLLLIPAEKSLDQYVREADNMMQGGNPSRLDRFIPGKLKLAIYELDQKTFSEFSFRTVDDMLQILSAKKGLELLGVVLQCEVAHRNSLLLASQHNLFIIRSTPSYQLQQILKPAAAAMKSTSHFAMATPNSATSPLSPAHPSIKPAAVDVVLLKVLKKNIISLQREKVPVRDHMLACFSRCLSKSLKRRAELDFFKSTLISAFSVNLTNIMAAYSLRLQIIRHYQGILRLLDDLPATKDAHFVVGKFKEEMFGKRRGGQQHGDFVTESSFGSGGQGFIKVQQGHQPQLINSDGSMVTNLWYIPHYTEVLILLEDLPIKEKCQQLHVLLGVVSGLHRILQYMCAYLQLGGESEWSGDLSHGRKEFGGAWGGTEGIGSELMELQRDISHLNQSSSPEEIAHYLNLRCKIVFYQHDITIRYYLRKALLSTNNTTALKMLDTVSVPATLQLSYVSFNPLSASPAHNIHYLSHSHMPQPLDCTLQLKGSSLVPWSYFMRHGLFPITLDHTGEVGGMVFSSLVCLGPKARCLAHGEFLGMSLLLEEVLQGSDLAVSLQREMDNSQKDSNEVLQEQHFLSSAYSSKRFSANLKPELLCASAASYPSFQTFHIASCRPLTSNTPPSVGRYQSSISPTPSMLDPSTQHLQLPPLEGSLLVEEFLILSSQVEQLKLEWWLKLLDTHIISTAKQHKDMEDAYGDRVLGWARKYISKKMSRDMSLRKLGDDEANESKSEVTLISETELSSGLSGLEGLDSVETLNEHKLKEVQLHRLLEVLEQQLLTDTSNYLSKLNHMILNERERDVDTLPLDLWRTNVSFKELTGLSRSHIVGDFISMLQSHVINEGIVGTGVGGSGMVNISVEDLKECLHVLSSGVLAREKECYQLYASHYESLLRSQYNQLYLKNQEIEYYKDLSKRMANQTREEGLVFMAEHTQGLVMEVTALRTRLVQLQRSYGQKLVRLRKDVLSEYSTLVDQLFSSTMSIKHKFEEYRGQLFNDMTQSLADVKHSTAENIVRLKERLNLKREELPELHRTIGKGTVRKEVGQNMVLDGEGIQSILESNAKLMRTITRMRTVYNWNRHKAGVAHNTEMLSVQARLEVANKEYLRLKMEGKEETNSFKQQIHFMQKQLDKVENEREMAKRDLKEEKLKQSSSNKSSSKTHDHFLSKTEKSYAARLDHLRNILEEKEQLLKAYEDEQERTRYHGDVQRSRAHKNLRGMKLQLGYERSLKLDAFHQVDDLLQQVEQYESRTFPTAYYSTPSLTPANLSTTAHLIPNIDAHNASLLTGSSSRIPVPLTIPTSKASRSRQARSARLPRPTPHNEHTDLNEKILALNLI